MTEIAHLVTKIIYKSIQHNLPLMMRNKTYCVRMVQLIENTMPTASFTNTS